MQLYFLFPYFTAILICYQLVTLSFVYAVEPQWTEREKGWLLSLTSPDHSEDDFGRETEESDRLLLERFKPRVIVSPVGLLPVDFYEFYLPNTVVRDLSRRRRIIKRSPDRDYLKRIERNKRYYLDYTGPMFPCEDDCKNYVATGYGMVYREKVNLRTGDGKAREIAIVVLKYSFVFPYSGLPAELGFLKEAAARLAADPVKWHELDIHGAVQIILNEQEKPMALLLAQHNYFRSYVIGKDIRWPEDDHIPVCFAERSNEPYPCHAETSPKNYRTVGNPMHIAYVIDGRSPPMTAGKDKVYGIEGGREVSYRLKFLPDKDPLCVSWIPLGDRQKLLFFDSFYRKGPPGIDLNTWPEVKKYGDIMQFWYIRDDDREDADLMQTAFKSFTDVDFETVLNHNGSRLYQDLKAIGYINHQ